MLKGLNCGAGDPIAHLLPGMIELGVQVVRQDLPYHKDWRYLVREFIGCPIPALFLIGPGKVTNEPARRRLEPDEAAAQTREAVSLALSEGVNCFWEFGNEFNISTPTYAARPQDAAEFNRQCYEAAREAGADPVRLFAGGTSNISKDALRYQQQMYQAWTPPVTECGQAVHRYSHGMNATTPHPGYASRAAEWSALERVIGIARRVAVTEFGHHVGPRRDGLFGLIKKRITEQQQLDDILYDFRFFASQGCALAILYQYFSGAQDIYEEQYGIYRADGSPRPATKAFQVA